MSLAHFISQNDLQSTIATVEEEGLSILTKPCSSAATPLHYAARLGRAEILEYFLRIDGIDVCDKVDDQGQNLLHNTITALAPSSSHRAVKNNNNDCDKGHDDSDDISSQHEVMRHLCLYKNGALLNSAVAKQDGGGLITPLSIAIDAGNVDISLFLLQQPHICKSLRMHHEEQLVLQTSSPNGRQHASQSLAPAPLLHRAAPFAPIVEALLRHYRSKEERDESSSTSTTTIPSSSASASQSISLSGFVCECDASFGKEVIGLRCDATLHMAIEINAIDTVKLLVASGVDPRTKVRDTTSGKLRCAIDLARELNRREILDQVVDPPRPFHSLGHFGAVGLCDVFREYPRGALQIQELRDAFTPMSLPTLAASRGRIGGLTTGQRRLVQAAAECIAFGQADAQADEDENNHRNDDNSNDEEQQLQQQRRRDIAPLLHFVRALASCSHSNETRSLWPALTHEFGDAAVHEAVCITATACFLSRFAAGHGILCSEMDVERQRVAQWAGTAAAAMGHVQMLREIGIVPRNYSAVDHFGPAAGIPAEAEIDAPHKAVAELEVKLAALQQQWQDEKNLLSHVFAAESVKRRQLEQRLLVIDNEAHERLDIAGTKMQRELMLLSETQAKLENLQRENECKPLLLAETTTAATKTTTDKSGVDSSAAAAAGTSTPASDGGLCLLRHVFISETMIRKESETRAQIMLCEGQIRLSLTMEFRPLSSIVSTYPDRSARPRTMSQDESAASPLDDALQRAIAQTEQAILEESYTAMTTNSDTAVPAVPQQQQQQQPYRPRPPSQPVGKESLDTVDSSRQPQDSDSRGEYTSFSAQRRPPRLIGSHLVSPTASKQQSPPRAAAAPPFTARALHEQMYGASRDGDFEVFKGDALTEDALKIQFHALAKGRETISKDEFCNFYLNLESFGLPVTEWEFEQAWWKIVGKKSEALTFRHFSVWMLRRSNM